MGSLFRKYLLEIGREFETILSTHVITLLNIFLLEVHLKNAKNRN